MKKFIINVATILSIATVATALSGCDTSSLGGSPTISAAVASGTCTNMTTTTSSQSPCVITLTYNAQGNSNLTLGNSLSSNMNNFGVNTGSCQSPSGSTDQSCPVFVTCGTSSSTSVLPNNNNNNNNLGSTAGNTACTGSGTVTFSISGDSINATSNAIPISADGS